MELKVRHEVDGHATSADYERVRSILERRKREIRAGDMEHTFAFSPDPSWQEHDGALHAVLPYKYAPERR